MKRCIKVRMFYFAREDYSFFYGNMTDIVMSKGVVTIISMLGPSSKGTPDKEGDRTNF